MLPSGTLDQTKLAGTLKEDRRHDLARQIERLDAEIDALVFGLYGLTEEEIRIKKGESRIQISNVTTQPPLRSLVNRAILARRGHFQPEICSQTFARVPPWVVTCEQPIAINAYYTLNPASCQMA